jgi:hypothetical protein
MSSHRWGGALALAVRCGGCSTACGLHPSCMAVSHYSLCRASAQDMASRGVSCVYSLGSGSQRAQLVQSLVGVLQGSTAASAKTVKVQRDTQVGCRWGGGCSTQLVDVVPQHVPQQLVNHVLIARVVRCLRMAH